MKTALATAALGLSLLGSTSACYKATFYRDATVTRAEAHEQWTNFYVFGLVGNQSIDVHQFCPSGDVAIVQTGGNFGTGLVGVLTLGIYTPRKVYVTCASSDKVAEDRQLELALDRHGQPRVARIRREGRLSALHISAIGNRAWQISGEAL